MLSTKHNAIFVHIPKTGGQTITKLLANPSMLFHTGVEDGIEYAHMTASQLRNIVPDYNTLFKFAFVRNPWDRLVSEYYYRIAGGGVFPYLDKRPKSFAEYVRMVAKLNICSMQHACVNHICPQREFVYDGSDLIVDCVERYEDYEAGVRRIMQRLGVEFVELPHINSTRHNHYTDYYPKKLRDIVSWLYADDIKTFGYTWPR
jgi:hypothetical protein